MGAGICGKVATFVASGGNVTDEVIAEYIEKQAQLAPEEGDQDFSVEDL